MTDRPERLPSVRPPRGASSGEHPAVREMHACAESFDTHGLADLRALAERTTRLASRVPDPRREGTSDPPVDVVMLPPAMPRTGPPPPPSGPDLEPDSDATPEPNSEP